MVAAAVASVLIPIIITVVEVYHLVERVGIRIVGTPIIIIVIIILIVAAVAEVVAVVRV